MPKAPFVVMDEIRSRRGLCTKIARRLKIDQKGVWQWDRVPLKHAISVARITGISSKVIRAEHERHWPITLIDLVKRLGYTVGKPVRIDIDEAPANQRPLISIEGQYLASQLGILGSAEG